MKFKSMIKFFFIFNVGIIQLQANAAEDQSYIYKNQRGSTLELTKHAQSKEAGILTGSFITAVGNCKPDMGVSLPISGYYNGNAVTLSINFPHCKQVVSMTGNFNVDEHELNTLWLDASQTADPTRADWNTNIIGTDHYQRIN